MGTKVTLISLGHRPCSYHNDGRQSRPVEVTISFQQGAVKGNSNYNSALLSLFEKGVTHDGQRALINDCPTCNSCVPLRVNTRKFEISRTQNKLIKDTTFTLLKISDMPAEQMFTLFKKYIENRHQEKRSHMNKWNYQEFKKWYESSNFILVATDSKRRILGYSLIVGNSENMSLKYSVYDPSLTKKSIGKQLWIGTIKKAQDLSINYVYVGSWSDGSPKLDYKKNHSGLETLANSQWVDFDPNIHKEGPDYTTILNAPGLKK